MRSNERIDKTVFKKGILNRLDQEDKTLDEIYEAAIPVRMLEQRQTAQVAAEAGDEFYDDLKEFGLVGEEKIGDLDQGVRNRLHMMIQGEIVSGEREKLRRRREAARRGMER